MPAPLGALTGSVAAYALILSGLATPQSAVAQDDQTAVIVSADLDFKTRYLFAGIPFATGHVQQATVNVGYGGFTFHGYAVYDVDLEFITERDVWGDYYHQISDLIGGFVGAALYNFKIEGENGFAWVRTPEIYGGLTASLPGNPTLYVARDLDLTEGTHGNVSVSHTITAGRASFSATGLIEYNDGYYREYLEELEGSSFAFASLNVSAALPLSRLTLSPNVTLLGGLDDDFKDRVFWGINLHVDF